MISKISVETPKNLWVDEFICLRSKMCAFNCDDSKNKLKCILLISIKKILNLNNLKFVQMELNIKKECDNYIVRSINHEMYHQRVQKYTLSPFDDKRCYRSNIESEPWN